MKDSNNNDTWNCYTHEHALIVIGKIEETSPYYDEVNGVVVPATFQTGYHANIKCKEWVEKLIPDSIIIPEPNNKRRVFA